MLRFHFGAVRTVSHIDRLIASPNETLKPIRAAHGAHRAITAHALDVSKDRKPNQKANEKSHRNAPSPASTGIAQSP